MYDNRKYRKNSFYCHAITHRYCKCTYGHTDRTDYQQRFAPEAIYCKDCNQCKDNIHNTHNNRLHHATSFCTCIFKNTRSIVKHCIDADSLLEYGKQNTDNNYCHSISKEFFCFFVSSSFNIIKNFLCFCLTIDLFQN